MVSFFQLTLRTLDVAAARAFYGAVLGDAVLDVVPLHENAIARGARPHWLGFLLVDDVARATADFTAHGASAFGPPWTNPTGLQASVMRDPGGAILALAKPGPTSPQFGPDVAWYLLNTPDVARAKTSYAAVFDWQFHAPLDMGEHGVFHPFSYEAGAPPVGSMCDVAGRAGVHPHWLFQLRVPSVGRAVAAVRAKGGSVALELTLTSGERLAVCDDDQGAAFSLRGAT